jgi:hypothetical protein
LIGETDPRHFVRPPWSWRAGAVGTSFNSLETLRHAARSHAPGSRLFAPTLLPDERYWGRLGVVKLRGAPGASGGEPLLTNQSRLEQNGEFVELLTFEHARI